MSIRGPLTPLFLVLWLAGCGGHDDSRVVGVWGVDLGRGKGALELRDGTVHAHCFGGKDVGSYEMAEVDVLRLTLQFRSTGPRFDLLGRVVPIDEAGFRLEREGGEGALVFEPYTGDCSEVRGGAS